MHLMGRYTSVSESNSQRPRPAPAYSRSGVAPGQSCPQWQASPSLCSLERSALRSSRGEEGMRTTGPPQSVGRGLTRGRGFPRKKKSATHSHPRVCQQARLSHAGTLKAFSSQLSPSVYSTQALQIQQGLSSGAGSARIIKNAEMFSKTDASPQQS